MQTVGSFIQPTDRSIVGVAWEGSVAGGKEAAEEEEEEEQEKGGEGISTSHRATGGIDTFARFVGSFICSVPKRM